MSNVLTQTIVYVVLLFAGYGFTDMVLKKPVSLRWRIRIF